ncbi:hypothetical protein PUN28_007605 [Cardiocondyla obscurior]|uniref:Ribosomal protein L2 n=1 Tax=Cardiocondyla obscurior TaxID=286306 RepID=A0AAW2G464_9HYME
MRTSHAKNVPGLGSRLKTGVSIVRSHTHMPSHPHRGPRRTVVGCSIGSACSLQMGPSTLPNPCFEVSDLYNESRVLSNKQYPRSPSLYLQFFFFFGLIYIIFYYIYIVFILYIILY